MARKPTKPHTNIYLYSDFRPYLKDLVKELKKLRPQFTMRSFARQAGFGSPSYLKMILDGKRTLTPKSLQKFCEVLGIKGRDKDYFSTLVAFHQSRDPDEKKELFDTLNRLSPRTTFPRLKIGQRKYLSNDYYACIREMVLLKDFREDAKWIAARCLPRIKPAQAREAMQTLLDLGLLKRDARGKLAQAEPIVDTGQQADFIEAFGFHEAVLNKARRSLSHLEQEKRHLTALTIPLPCSLEGEIIKRIDDFQNEILRLINVKDMEYDEVSQLSIQFFPVTAPERAGPKED